MIRILLFLAIVTCISLGISWMADEPGQVVIDWSNYHIETSVLALVSAVTVLVFTCMMLYSLLHILISTPHNWKRTRRAKHQLLGLESISATFAAIATQDTVTAHKKLKQAQKYLPSQPITLMLSAQLARMEGNESKSRLYIEQMLGNEVTEFMALRSLIEKARNNNFIDEAIAHAKKALAIKPGDNWLIATLAGLYAQAGQSQDAVHLLDTSLKKRYINRKFFLRETAHVLFEDAQRLVLAKRMEAAIDLLERTLGTLPDYREASVLLAQVHMMRDDIAKAVKTISSAWKITPHQELRETLTEVLEKYSGNQKILSSVEKIATIHPEHEETGLLYKAINEKARMPA